MELSAIDSYARKPHSDAFPVGDQSLPVEWDKAVFTGRFIASLFDEMKARQSEVLTQIESLGGELEGADESKASELTGRVIHLRAEIEEIEQRVYSRALADKVLLSWGMTDGGVPVPISFEVLMSKPREFVADLFAFCRRKSLPEVAQKKTSGASLTTPATSPCISPPTVNTRQRSARRRSRTPKNLPSQDASASPSLS